MRAAQRIEQSLAKTRLERLVVCLGYEDGSNAAATRGALAGRVAQSLLHRCQPGSSDIHDPDRTRLHARDREGRPRAVYGARGRQGRHGHPHALRSPQTWDSSRVVDFMGVWCDRLLLGDARCPARCAVLEPRVPPALWGEALARVAQAHRHLRCSDVLVVRAVDELPFGVARLELDAASLWAAEKAQSPRGVSLGGATAVPDALRLFAPSAQPPHFLRLGIGAAHGTQSLLAAEEERHAERLLVPLCAFVVALWSVSPEKAREYVASVTATPHSLTEETANHRLWRTMQHAMLSTRDTALLRAHFGDEGLDARLSPEQRTYLAETLLQRLRGEDESR